MKQMTSRFTSGCNVCSNLIRKGDTIMHYGKGKGAAHLDCHKDLKQSETAPGDAWASALSWDAAPAAGASINQPVANAAEPAPLQHRADYDDMPASQVAELVATRADRKRDESPTTQPSGPQPVNSGSLTIGSPQRAPIRHAGSDPQVRLVRDLMVTMVNAICDMNDEQRRDLRKVVGEFVETAGNDERREAFTALKGVA